jgi:hypothetical protein
MITEIIYFDGRGTRTKYVEEVVSGGKEEASTFLDGCMGGVGIALTRDGYDFKTSSIIAQLDLVQSPDTYFANEAFLDPDFEKQYARWKELGIPSERGSCLCFNNFKSYPGARDMSGPERKKALTEIYRSSLELSKAAGRPLAVKVPTRIVKETGAEQELIRRTKSLSFPLWQPSGSFMMVDYGIWR